MALENQADIKVAKNSSIEKCKKFCLNERARSDPCMAYTFFEITKLCHLKNSSDIKDLKPNDTATTGKFNLGMCLNIVI